MWAYENASCIWVIYDYVGFLSYLKVVTLLILDEILESNNFQSKYSRKSTFALDSIFLRVKIE